MKNNKYIKRSLKSVWHPCTQMKHHENLPLIPIERGRGVWLYDFDGKKYLDVTSSWWVNLFGHNNKIIKKYITRQLNTLEHSMLAGLTHSPVIELSEKLSKLTKSGALLLWERWSKCSRNCIKNEFSLLEPNRFSFKE